MCSMCLALLMFCVLCVFDYVSVLVCCLSWGLISSDCFQVCFYSFLTICIVFIGFLLVSIDFNWIHINPH